MTVLVTGCTGQVGSRLVPRLVRSGVQCRALVRAGKPIPADVIGVAGDVLDAAASLAEAVTGVSAVVHLAARFRTPDAAAIWNVNVDGTRNLIAACRQHAPEARVIMASTGLVYTDDLPHPAKEDDPTAADPAAYPASKIAAEQELQSSGLTWSILRFAYVYGDGDGHLQAAPRLCGSWNWHPAQTLSLIHHRDIATAIELALTGATDGKIVNITDEAAKTIYEIADIVGADYDESAAPLPNPWKAHLDGSLARELGFRPTVPTVHQATREGAL